MNLLAFVYPAFVFLAIVLAIFLFWRACRHELFDSSEAFDLIGVSILGALIFSRVFDFVFKADPETWSLATLIFFNRYGGFDYYGAVFGVFVALLVYLKGKKTDVFSVIDLMAPALVFGQAIVALGAYISFGRRIDAFYFIGYLLIFMVIKRLASRKRHKGFLVCFWIFSIFLLDMILFKFRANVHFLGKVSYEFAAPFAFAVAGIIVWYVLAKRNPADDIKNFLALIVLSAFRTKRMITSADESGKFSKSIIFFPYYILKLVFGFLQMLAREAKLGFLELLYVFGLRRFFK